MKVVIAYRNGRPSRVPFTYAFAENVASSFTTRGRDALAAAASALIAADDEQVTRLLIAENTVEVDCDADNQIQAHAAVAQWERGAKRPSGPAMRLLEVLDPERADRPVVQVRRDMDADQPPR